MKKSTPKNFWSIKKYEKMLGTMRDSALARKLGINQSAVGEARILRKIAPFGKVWTKENIKKLGKFTDEDLAKKLNINVATAKVARLRRNIKCFRKKR